MHYHFFETFPMTTVLVIGYVWPEPNSSAAGTHMMSLLNLFKKQNWRVIFATPAQHSDHMVDLSQFGIESNAITLNDSSFDHYLEEVSPDIVMFDRFMMEEQFGWRVRKSAPNAMAILDTEDLQCLRNARHLAHKQSRSMTNSDLFTSDIAKREIAAIARSDLSLIISSYEYELLTTAFNIDPKILHHLPFMVSKTHVNSLPYSNREHFVVIGNFRHAPNWDSVLYLQQLWPLIRKQLPKAELHIYGSYPPPKATALHNVKQGFMIKGWADDALEVIGQAKVCLAPLRFGAGIKGKLLDAMLVSTPSITTDIGIEGMTDGNEWPGAIANDAEQFVQQAINLYQNEDEWNRAVANCGSALEMFDAAPLGLRLIESIHGIQSTLTQHREDNFLGAMLNHHSMKSTQYMSQWIEVKNKLETIEHN